MTQTPQNYGFRVVDLPQNTLTGFELQPDPSQLSALAAELDLLSLRKLRFKGTIGASGEHDWQMTGHLGATVVQPCVVTLVPVTTRIEVDVQRRFFAGMEVPEGEEEIEMPKDDNCELLTSHIDPEAVMLEALAMSLPQYPRADGAELNKAVFTEPGKTAMTDQDARPFAGLAGLRNKLADGDEGA